MSAVHSHFVLHITFALITMINDYFQFFCELFLKISCRTLFKDMIGNTLTYTTYIRRKAIITHKSSLELYQKWNNSSFCWPCIHRLTSFCLLERSSLRAWQDSNVEVWQWEQLHSWTLWDLVLNPLTSSSQQYFVRYIDVLANHHIKMHLSFESNTIYKSRSF